MLTAAEAAARLGISMRAVYDLAATGELACYRLGVGRRSVRFDEADVESYKASCRFVGTPGTSDGATNLTASLTGFESGLRAYFQRAGVRPKQTPTTEEKAAGSTLLRLVSKNETP